MPTLIPVAAEENLHPNRRQNSNKNGLLQTSLSTPATHSSLNKTGLTKHSFNPTPRGKTAATTQRTNVRSEPKFRENAPHVAGKRVGFHPSTKGSNVGKSNPVSSLQRKGGLAAFARIYSQNTPIEPTDEPNRIEPIHREFTHSTNAEVKQSLSYSNWINHLVSPYDSRTTLTTHHSPRNFSALLMHQARSTEFHSAHNLFNSSSMRKVRDAIEREVGRGRLVMRSDSDFENVLLREELVGVLMSYSGRWLGLGLGVVLGLKGEGMWETSNKHAIEKTITERLLSDPTTHKRYTGGKVKTPSGKYETALREQIQHHALTKMLTLVTFLDTAKMEHVLSDDPCLFERTSKVKSSHHVLATICRLCFAREKEIIHHMTHLGISVHHIQKPLDEYEYYVRNLATDLKDGVRLAKMTELVTGRTVLDKLRLPATSRSHCVFNVGEVLSTLVETGVENIQDITASHIVEAHQPRILQLLWSTIVRFQIESLDSDVIEEEIRGIECWKEKRGSGASSSVEYSRETVVKLVQNKYSESSEGIKDVLLAWCQAVCSYYNVPVENFGDSFSDGRVLCLLVSFYHPSLLASRDILPTVTDIQSKLKLGVKMDDQLVQKGLQNERYNLSLALNSIDQLGGIPRLFSSKNILLPPDENTIILCVSFLFSRLTETSAEIVAAREIQKWWHRSLLTRKSVAASFLFKQWNLQKENYFRNQRSKFRQSVKVIESFYKDHETKFKKMSWMRRKRNSGASIIQSIVRMLLISKSFQIKLARHRASRLIQSSFRMVQAIKEAKLLRRQKASITIQKLWRSNRIHSAYNFLRRGVTAFQSVWRFFCCRCQYNTVRSRCIVAQSAVRRYLAIARLSTAVQSNFRHHSFFRQYLRWCSEKRHHLIQKHGQNNRGRDKVRVQALFNILESRGAINLQAVRFYSTLHIQCTYRGFNIRSRIKAMGLASINIQRIWRRYKAQLVFGFDLMDIITIQSIGRRYLAQKAMKRMQTSATTILRILRAYKARLSFGYDLMDIIIAQSVARRYINRTRFTKQQAASKLLQCIWRRHRAQRRYCRLLVYIVTSQSIARRFIYQKCFITQRKSSILIQNSWRQWRAKQLLVKALWSVTIMQSAFNSFVARRMLGSKRASAVRIQSFSRRVIAKKRFDKIRLKEIMRQAKISRFVHRSAARTIQVSYRLRLLSRSHENAATIQRSWRGYFERQQYHRSQIRVVMIQTQARRYIAERALARLKSNPIPLLLHLDATIPNPPYPRNNSSQQCIGQMSSINAVSTTLLAKDDSSGLIISLPPNSSPPPDEEVVDTAAANAHGSTLLVSLMTPPVLESDTSALPHARMQSALVDTTDDNAHASRNEDKEEKELWYNNSLSTHMPAKNERAACHATQQATWHERTVATRDENNHSDEASETRATASHETYDKFVSDASRHLPSPSIYQVSEIESEGPICFAESAVAVNTPIINIGDQVVQPLNDSSKEKLEQADTDLSMDHSRKFVSRHSQCRKGNRQVSVMTLCDDEESYHSLQEETAPDYEHNHILSPPENERAEYHLITCDTTTVVPNHHLAEIKTHGVQTRSKVMLLSALDDSRRKDIKQQMAPTLYYSAEDVTTRSRSSSLDLSLTYKALAIIENSRLLSEVKEAVKTLERTTHGSKECCKYFVKARGQNMLCALITSCNRSSPHLELTQLILLTLTNVAKCHSAAQRLASNEVAEVIIYVCQMYRDKAKLFSLASSLLERILQSNDNIKTSYSTQTQKMRLHGILSLCKKRLRTDVGNSHLETGVASLENVIHIVDQH